MASTQLPSQANARSQEQKRREDKKRSMPSLAGLWPGFHRSHAATDSSGIKKSNSSKRKSKQKKGTPSSPVERRQSTSAPAHAPASLHQQNPSIDARSMFAIEPPQEDNLFVNSNQTTKKLVYGHGGSWSKAQGNALSGSPSVTFVTPGRPSKPDQSSSASLAPVPQPGQFQRQASSASAGSHRSIVSPIVDSGGTFHGNLQSPSASTRMSLVSPLSTDMPQVRPSRSSVTVKSDRTPVSAFSKGSSHSRTNSHSTNPSTNLSGSPSQNSKYSPSVYSLRSDKSSVISPTRSRRSLPPNSSREALYESSTANDGLGRKQFLASPKYQSLNLSLDKPLPPEPGNPLRDSLGRQDSTLQPSRTTQSSGDSEAQPVSLPSEPLPRDLSSLDDAFRRSGLVLRRTPQPQHQPQQQQQQQPSSLPWQKASDELEARLSNLTSSTVAPSSTTTTKTTSQESPHSFSVTNDHRPLRHSTLQSPPEGQEDDKTEPRSKRRTFDMGSFRELKNQASQKVNANFRTQSSPAATGHSSKDPNGAPSLSEMPEEQPFHDNSVSGTVTASPHRIRGGLSGQTSNPALGEKVNRTLTFSRSSRKGAENLRLRLPRLQTTDLAPGSHSDRQDLSVVMESPVELDSRCINLDGCEASATEKIVSALSSDTRRSPYQQHLEMVSEENNRSPNRCTQASASVMAGDTNNSSPRTNSFPSHGSSPIPAAAAESIILRIMEHVDNLEDLFSLAVINRGFYRILKQHELPLIKQTLFRTSPAAWELREMSPPWEHDELCMTNMDLPVPEYTPELYMRHYTRDLYTMIALKSLILVHCESFLRPETVRALAGLDEARSAEVDDAFWRVWTFCRIFGCGKSREEDVTAQADWLSGGRLSECDSRGSSMVVTHDTTTNSVLADPPHGFSKGNGDGLSSKQLYDMMEIWTSLGVLLQVLHGKYEEARKYGVFDDMNIKQGDISRESAALEAWTQYLLTLGPSAILALVSLNPSSSVGSMFSRAQSYGWTKWTPPTQAESGSCRWFLKEAVSRVHEYQLVRSDDSNRISMSTPRTSQSCTDVSRSSSAGKSSQTSVSDDGNNRQRQADFAAEIRKRRKGSDDLGAKGVDLTSLRVPQTAEERPISSFHEVVGKLEDMAFSPSSPAPPVPQVPTINVPQDTPASSSQHPRPHSHGAVEEKICQGRHTWNTRESHFEEPQVFDPADIAVNKLVRELGFSEADAKWALKFTDTGESLDIEAAIHLLLQREEETNAHGSAGQSSSSTDTLGRSKTMSALPAGANQTQTQEWRPTWRWA